VAIRFPPGSTGRGWVPVTDLESVPDLERLAVTLPTPLPQRTVSPSEGRFGFGSSGNGTGGFDLDDDDLTGTPRGTTTAGAAGTSTPRGPSPTPTATPRPGPVDLVVTAMSRLPDGRVSVTVLNRGPGDVAGQLMIGVGDVTRSESLSTDPRRIVAANTSVTLQTTSFRATEHEVTALIDPFFNLNDPNRGNNTFAANLTVEATPTPGSQ
jgi:hypothetical protein